MFCNLVFQQHLQPLCLLQFFEEHAVINFAKKHAVVCLEALLVLLNVTGGFSSEKTHTTDCWFILGL